MVFSRERGGEVVGSKIILDEVGIAARQIATNKRIAFLSSESFQRLQARSEVASTVP
jgi:hypothetical protein